jgi:hypothetical protein
MSKKMFAVSAASLLVLAACAAPTDVADDLFPPVDDIVIDDLFFGDVEETEPEILWDDDVLFLEEETEDDSVELLITE